MHDLTQEQLQAKITQVERDIEIVRSTNKRGSEHLGEYLEYLKDELKQLRRKDGSSQSS
jgi:iron-sulfur cluster repair protein YtfE (RIC family)